MALGVITVTLCAIQIEYGEKIAAERDRRHVPGRGVQPRFGQTHAQTAVADRIGTLGEQAVALHFDIPWPLPGDVQGPDGDVGPYEVRTTSRSNGRLILHDDDIAERPARPFILVIARSPLFALAGWYKPNLGVEPTWWHEYRPGGGAYYVPRAMMLPMAQLSVNTW